MTLPQSKAGVSRVSNYHSLLETMKLLTVTGAICFNATIIKEEGDYGVCLIPWVFGSHPTWYSPKRSKGDDLLSAGQRVAHSLNGDSTGSLFQSPVARRYEEPIKRRHALIVSWERMNERSSVYDRRRQITKIDRKNTTLIAQSF